MRLLNCETMVMEEFFDEDIPPYAILSHTWDGKEVSYQDFHDVHRRKGKRGFKKIQGFCARARGRGYKWVWIDTCCIDKSSSAELSEAINSMFLWYQASRECFVYLSDVTWKPDDEHKPGPDWTITRWFTRGWTLQELLAPWNLCFYDRNWEFIGYKHSLSASISAITSIPEEILVFPYKVANLRSTPIAQRISWASNRRTSRKEDMAYCLLGLLGVNMPLLYGEGNRAFIRLQEEIIRTTYDHTILLWGVTGVPCSGSEPDSQGCLSTSPSAFRSWNPRISTYAKGNHYLLTNLGIYIELRMWQFVANGKKYGLAFLDCGISGPDSALPLELESREGSAILATRARGIMPFEVSTIKLPTIPTIPLYLASSQKFGSSEFPFQARIYIGQLASVGYYLSDYFPPCHLRYDNNGKAAYFTVMDTSNYDRLFRLCCPSRKTILLRLKPSGDENFLKSRASLYIASTTLNDTTWQLLLGSPPERISFTHFDAPYRPEIVWTWKGYLARHLPQLQGYLNFTDGEMEVLGRS
ncbi:HET-domain-containing protein [Hypoxylon trugodes]|uniref:HET-domain-containing protein n=1 Tax=Hypoxylon trugodes TaxID=326681 RepID=UPI00218D9A4D|nr:HET-domain-containing protein [Hypoxylon trugodes]KAI1385415.1 HET-domain-containing protein [Hypoxylon trugodes]